MAKKDAAAKTGMAQPSEHEKPTEGKAPDPPAEKTRRKSLTNAQLIAALKAQGGRCYVTGAELGDDTADIDGKLVTGAVKKYAGQRGLVDLRVKLATDLANAKHLNETFGGMLDEKFGIIFAGEKAAQ